MNEYTEATPGVLQHKWVVRLTVAFLAVATIFVGARALEALITLDASRPPASNIITVDGEGSVNVIPDIATISYTVSAEAVTASAAQDTYTKKANVALEVIKQLGVEEKDIKTTSYSIAPKYAYAPPCYSGYCPPNNEGRVVGYTVSETKEVKVRDTKKVGDVLAKLGDAGVSNLYGPNFTIDDEDAPRAQARKEAILKAQAKAKVLAKDLGVRLSRIVNFSESGGPMPYYAYSMGGASADVASKAETPPIQTGENKITVNVSISYEIR